MGMNEHVQPIVTPWHDNVLAQMTERFTEKIDAFFTLFIYEMNEMSALQMEQFLAENIDVTDSTMFLKDFKIYVLTADSYYMNEQLYVTIRQQAREKVISNFIQFAVLYALKRRPHVTLSTVTSSAQLMSLFKHVEAALVEKVKGREIATWKDYNAWWKQRITEKTLEHLILHYGVQQLEQATRQQFNALFLETLNIQFMQNERFLQQMNEESKHYYQSFVTLMVQEVNEILAQYDKSQQRDATTDFSQLTAVPNYVSVPNFVVYQAIREVMYQKNFTTAPDTYPTATFSKGRTNGSIMIHPCCIDDEVQRLERAHEHRVQLSTIAVDVLDILCVLFIYRAKHPTDTIEVELADILKMRGLREKLGGQGRRGGFEKKQKEQIIGALQHIQSLLVTVDQTTLYKQNKPTQVRAQGRIFLFQTATGEPDKIRATTCRTKITFTVDTLFAKYLLAPKKQLALLPIVALTYHAYRMSAEKQLSRYLSWRWRTQAFKGNYLQPNKVRTILHAMGETLNERAPMRTRERLEKTLDTLMQDGVIADWHYVKWDEQIATTRGWAKYWLNTALIIEPADQVKEHYASIEQNNRYRQAPPPTQKDDVVGAQLTALRKSKKLTILQLAEQLGVTAPHISNIEKNKARPSPALRKKIIAWMEQQ